MLQAIRMVTDVFVRWQWLLKAVCICRVVERTYRVRLGREAGQIPHRLGQGRRKWHAAFTAVILFYFFCPTSFSTLWRICGYTHTYLTAYRLFMNYLCYQITLQWNIFTQIGNDAKCWLDNWRIKNQLDATCYFIVLLIGSTCFGHYYAHHQELATVMLITTLAVSFSVCCMLEVKCS